MKLNMLEPRATEKSYLEQTNRIYVFPVKKSMSKQAIARQVEEEFNVTVTDVRTMIRKGKKTRFSRGKHAYPGTTYRQDKKFAYVRLKKGNSIRVFDEDTAKEEPKKTNKTSAKEAKKLEKAAEKATKKAEKADKNAGKEKK
ncbi:50S ribosomal protein L23 [Candidatus Saccharibacteria bacterium]|nr:50S ribosomal protein L23 [Candidatus Saccharibacteria bacterium]